MMTYRKSKIPVLSSREWYNAAAKIYASFHKDLASYDKWLFHRFLPRDMTGKRVLDVGAGDARLYSYFADKDVAYTAMDCAEELLKRAPGRAEKVVGDINQPWPFADGSYDVVLCFFVLLHLSDLDHFFVEANRVLTPGGRLIILHNYQRRSFTYDIHGKKFKIQDRHHRDEDIVEIGESYFSSSESIPLIEKDATLGKLYCFVKDA